MRSGNLYGMAARYNTTDELAAAAAKARNEGFRDLEVYSPFPVEEVNDILGYKETLLPWVVFAAGAAGAIGGFIMQYAANVWSMPLDIGGRPYNSWPAFIPITFELTILFAAIAGFLGIVIRCGLPRLYHPVFNAPSFERASRDSFFLCIGARDPLFDDRAVRLFLEETHPQEISRVEI